MGWNLGENVTATFPAGGGQKAHELVYHSSAPPSRPSGCQFLIITKARKNSCLTCQQTQTQSNPFRPNLRPGKALTKQSSPWPTARVPGRPPSLSLLLFVSLEGLVWKSYMCPPGRQLTLLVVLNNFAESCNPLSPSWLLQSEASPILFEVLAARRWPFMSRLRTGKGLSRVRGRDKSWDFCPQLLISPSCDFPEQTATWQAPSWVGAGGLDSQSLRWGAR